MDSTTPIPALPEGRSGACTPLDQDTPEPISRLRPGEVAVVAYVQAAEDDLERLKAMGVCAGRRVQMVKAGDPLIVRVLGSRIGVSGRLAQWVFVSRQCCR